MDESTVRRIPPDERVEGPPTPGMTRKQAVASERMWAGLVRTDAGMVSGWHHHGDFDTTIFVLSGAIRMEYGSAGTDRIDAGPGDFLHVMHGAVHRESNPTDDPADAVVVRSGTGESVVNVEGPAPT